MIIKMNYKIFNQRKKKKSFNLQYFHIINKIVHYLMKSIYIMIDNKILTTILISDTHNTKMKISNNKYNNSKINKI